MKILLVVIIVIGTITNSTAQEKRHTTLPNIVFILADDLGWADLSVYGNKFNESPNLEKLAREGMQFMNAYAANPVCSPTRASIQTGQYPARIGINDFLPGHWRPYEKVKVPTNETQYLPLEYQTIGEVLQKKGYKTGYFGKWHLGHNEKHYPKNQGYDMNVVYNGGGFFNYNELMNPKTDFEKGKVLSEAFTDLSLDFIEDNKTSPFFLFLAHYDVHVQLDAQDKLIKKYLKKRKVKGYPSNAVYAAMIENIDNSVGRIMKKLEALGLEDDTIIIFFSDNGGVVKRFDEIPLISKRSIHYYENDTLRYIATSNKPLRGGKGTLYEGGIKVPFLMKWPGKIKPNSKSELMISSIDFFPTLLAAANCSLPENQVVDGRDILAEITGHTSKERLLFWHYPVYHHDVPASAVRKGDWKLIHFLDDDHKELYYLRDDRAESENLASLFPEKTEELYRLLNNWRRNVNAAMPVANPDFDKNKRYEWTRHPGFDRMLKGN